MTNKNATENRQKKAPKLNLGIVFWTSAIIIVGASLIAMIIPKQFQAASEAVYAVISQNFTWFFLLLVFGFGVLLIFLALSPYGRIKLGDDDSEPEFAFWPWIGMLFSSGLGVGLVFFGVAEPMQHFVEAPFLGGPVRDAEAARIAMGYTYFHWGISQWSIFGVAGLAIGYFQYRKNRDGLVSTSLEPLFGFNYNQKSRNAIDILAIIATITGMATSVGLGILQMDGGLNHAFGLPQGPVTQIVLTVAMITIFILSTVTGLEKGMKFFSTLNMVLALFLTVFMIFFGPFSFIMESIVLGIGDYISNYVSYSLRAEPYNNRDWTREWTVFYWAWVIAWSPFIGSFVARVSRGRTIREYVAGILIVPPILSFLWVGALGGTAIYSDLFKNTDIASIVQEDETRALFELFNTMPFTTLTSIVAILLIFLFLVTSADSATFIVSGMSLGDTENPPLRMKVLWGVLLGVLTIALIIAGGLTSLQAASLLAGLPFAIVLILMIFSVLRSIRREPNKALARRRHSDNAKEEHKQY
ncbi:BCCT family transporter [Nosocomiicoccus ampullae]|uniref:BCCT family transporter n=1 Tax=Nosocomiicoccus ampullae TaxID=489910 RepID=UPI00214E4125|nr:BCCT family transporter [Nosocomiicoccus ampullae]